MKREVKLITGLIVILLLVGSVATAAEKPSIALNWYGYVKLDASYDQNLTSHGNFSMWVNPEGESDDEQFNMTHRQSRFGFKAKSKGYEGVNLAGQLEFDLYGSGGTENKSLLLLRHAYLSVGTGDFQLIAGQTWDLIGPLNPSTLNYPVLWGCGNSGYRRPQIRFTYTAATGASSNVKMAAGFFRTIGSDLTPTLTLSTEVSDGSDDGTDAGIPSVQGLLEFSSKSTSGMKFRAGVSGLWGQLKAEGNQGSEETYESQGVFGHMAVSFNNQFGLSGEGFSGSNLGSYNAGINNSNTIDGVNTVGGWAHVWFKPTAKVKLGAGFGFDDPDDADLSSNNRARNQSIFGNISVTPIKPFTVGLEISQWETEYKDAETAKNLRAQTSFILKF